MCQSNGLGLSLIGKGIGIYLIGLDESRKILKQEK